MPAFLIHPQTATICAGQASTPPAGHSENEGGMADKDAEYAEDVEQARNNP